LKDPSRADQELTEENSALKLRIKELEHSESKRKQVEEDLRKNEERYRTILEDIDEGYFEIDLAGDFTFVNDAECWDLGYSREELIGMNYRQYSDEATAKKSYELYSNIYKTGKPIKRISGQYISKDGTRHFNEVSASLIRDAKGKPIGFRGISQDVTDRKWAEEALQRAHDELERRVADRTEELARANEELRAEITDHKQAEQQLHDTMESLRRAVGVTIQVMASAVEARDPYTSGHQIRSADLARTIATEMGLPQEKIDAIRMAGSIHDIGKLSIPAEILSKPTKLSEIEFSLIKEHARQGYEMLKDVESPWPLAEIVRQHHERMDGSGYPRKLKGEEILIEARILAVADVVEAMASHRPYRPGLGIEAALREIEKNKGLFYDKVVADTCLRLFREKGFKLEGT
jgi:PAS domain S-box-containing protein/putative nucleotidyltransferase with HDIG domain